MGASRFGVLAHRFGRLRRLHARWLALDDDFDRYLLEDLRRAQTFAPRKCAEPDECDMADDDNGKRAKTQRAAPRRFALGRGVRHIAGP